MKARGALVSCCSLFLFSIRVFSIFIARIMTKIGSSRGTRITRANKLRLSDSFCLFAARAHRARKAAFTRETLICNKYHQDERASIRRWSGSLAARCRNDSSLVSSFMRFHDGAQYFSLFVEITLRAYVFGHYLLPTYHFKRRRKLRKYPTRVITYTLTGTPCCDKRTFKTPHTLRPPF